MEQDPQEPDQVRVEGKVAVEVEQVVVEKQAGARAVAQDRDAGRAKVQVVVRAAVQVARAGVLKTIDTLCLCESP